MSAIGACSSTPGDPTGQPICPIGTFPSNPPINNGMSGSGIDGMNIATDSGPLNIHKGPGGPIGLVANREMRASHLIKQKVAPGATGKITLYERSVDNGVASKIDAQHLYLLITTSSGQSIKIEAGPANQAANFGTGFDTPVVLQKYNVDNGSNEAQYTTPVALAVPNGESFSQFANQLINDANYFDMNNQYLYKDATSNSNSFMSGLLAATGSSGALATLNNENAQVTSEFGPAYTIPGANQPFAASSFGG